MSCCLLLVHLTVPTSRRNTGARLPAEYDAEGAYARHISDAAAGAAAALLARVTAGSALHGALGALKGYLLMARGDTLTTFLDTAEAELARPASEVSASRLQSLLELGTSLGMLLGIHSSENAAHLLVNAEECYEVGCQVLCG